MALKHPEGMHDVWVNVLDSLAFMIQNNIPDHLDNLLKPCLRKYTTGFSAANDLDKLFTQTRSLVWRTGSQLEVYTLGSKKLLFSKDRLSKHRPFHHCQITLSLLA